ncbi:hypothetical protein Fot_27767 [Forsythia ovata]|uniref:Uncharacterized protein n=1 Tax=Forsythia ovata TaxID=205694 RepID=A0ABD1TM31_9LAMI
MASILGEKGVDSTMWGEGGDGGIGSEEGDEVGVDSNYISNFQNESGHQAAVDVPKFLHPYDRASETLFSRNDIQEDVRISCVVASQNSEAINRENLLSML